MVFESARNVFRSLIQLSLYSALRHCMDERGIHASHFAHAQSPVLAHTRAQHTLCARGKYFVCPIKKVFSPGLIEACTKWKKWTVLKSGENRPPLSRLTPYNYLFIGVPK